MEIRILWIDFIRKAQLCISGDHLFYQNLPFVDNVECSVLTAIEALTVPPLSVLRVPVKVKSARGKKILAGTYGICFSAHERLGIWLSLNKVNHEAVTFSAFICVNCCVLTIIQPLLITLNPMHKQRLKTRP